MAEFVPKTWQDVTQADVDAGNAKAIANKLTAAHKNRIEAGIVEALSRSGTSEPGVDIQVGGTQPASGWWLDNGQPLPDTVAPSTPTGLTATATGGSTVNLSWSASSDNVGVTGYNYRIGTGAAVNAGAGTTETVGGLSGSTTYSFQVQAYDAQGNVSGWSASASATTLAGPDLTNPTPGTLAASAITSTTFTLTVTGASDTVGLHATPYAFSTDNGATWSAWQAGATHNVTGKAASTAYQARHKVRDAAGNEATGTAITVTTTAPAPLLLDAFTRATTGTGGTLGTAETGQAWVDASSLWHISDNAAARAGIGAGYVRAQTGQMSMRAVVTFRFTGTNTNYGFYLGSKASAISAGYWVELLWPSSGVTNVKLTAMNGTGTPASGLYGTTGGHTRAIADGDVFELTVVETGTAAQVTLKQNGEALYTNANFTLASRTTDGDGITLFANNVGSAGAIRDVTVYAA